MSLVTPLDPGTPGRTAAAPRLEVGEAVHSTLFGRIAAAVASSCGTAHAVNEDAHSPIHRSGSLYVVADGVGGGALAAMASRRLVAHLHAALEVEGIDADTVRQAVLDADRVIAQSIAQVTDAPGAATLALCAPVNIMASRWLVAWVGDCRVYRLEAAADGLLQALTVDDTFDHLQETPPPGSTRDDPARMVGNGAVVRPNVALADVGAGDLLVVCSDGVHKHLRPQDWHRILRRPAGLAQRCEELVETARANGSTDDATALLVQRAGFAVSRLSWAQRRGSQGGAR
jgi:protein phosphatase